MDLIVSVPEFTYLLYNNHSEDAKYFEKLSRVFCFIDCSPDKFEELRSINRSVRDNSQTIADFPFCCDSFRWTVASIRELSLSCLLALPIW